MQSCSRHTGEAAWQPSAAAAASPLHTGITLSLSVTAWNIQLDTHLLSLSLFPLLPLPLWVTARGETVCTSNSRLSAWWPHRRKRLPLSAFVLFHSFPVYAGLASFPSLSLSPLPLLLQLKRTRTANEREEAADRGRRKAWDWLPGAHVTPSRGPSTSCPAHASLQTSVAIDNSCPCSSPTTEPLHVKPLAGRIYGPRLLLWGEHVGTCSPICCQDLLGV